MSTILKPRAYTLLLQEIAKEAELQAERVCGIGVTNLDRLEFLANVRTTEKLLTQLCEECPEIFLHPK